MGFGPHSSRPQCCDLSTFVLGLTHDQGLSCVFAGGLAFYLVYGPGYEHRTAASIGFALAMSGTTHVV
jgi:hypothetical protein